MLYTRKKLYKYLALFGTFLGLSLLYGIHVSLSAQDNSRSFIPTGRSRPDAIPADEIIYIAPVVTEEDIYAKPSASPYFSPSINPSNNIEDVDNNNITEYIPPTAPAKRASFSPGKTAEMEEVVEDLVLVPPSEQLRPFKNPPYYPEDSPNIQPDGKALSFTPKNYPNPAGKITSISESPLNNPPSKRYTYPEANPSYSPPNTAVSPQTQKDNLRFELVKTPDEESTKNTFRESAQKSSNFELTPSFKEAQTSSEIQIAKEPKPQPQPVQSNNVQIITQLGEKKYIQLAGYNQQYKAENAINMFMKQNFDFPTSKFVIYKAYNTKNNITYYRVVAGPFSQSEVGVQMYHLRNKGFNDIFIAK